MEKIVWGISDKNDNDEGLRNAENGWRNDSGRDNNNVHDGKDPGGQRTVQRHVDFLIYENNPQAGCHFTSGFQ